MWKAFSAVCKRRDRTAAADLTAHMERTIRLYGTDEEKQLLADAEAELCERPGAQGRSPSPRGMTEGTMGAHHSGKSTDTMGKR